MEAGLWESKNKQMDVNNVRFNPFQSVVKCFGLTPVKIFKQISCMDPDILGIVTIGAEPYTTGCLGNNSEFKLFKIG